MSEDDYRQQLLDKLKAVSLLETQKFIVLLDVDRIIFDQILELGFSGFDGMDDLGYAIEAMSEDVQRFKTINMSLMSEISERTKKWYFSIRGSVATSDRIILDLVYSLQRQDDWIFKKITDHAKICNLIDGKNYDRAARWEVYNRPLGYDMAWNLFSNCARRRYGDVAGL